MRQILSVALWVAFCATTQISPAATIEPVFLDTPLTIHTKQAPVASRDFATRLRLDTSKLDLASGSQFVFIENVPLDQHRSVTLQLEEASAVSPNATFVVMRHDERGRLYEDQMPWPKSYIYRGTVVGEPNSDVFLAIGKDIVNGWIAIDGTRFIIGTRSKNTLLGRVDGSPGLPNPGARHRRSVRQARCGTVSRVVLQPGRRACIPVLGTHADGRGSPGVRQENP